MSEKSADNVWNNCLKLIQDNVSPQSFKTWFEPIKPIKLENKVLTIQVPSQFFYEWLEEHYITLLKKTIRKELGVEGRLEYSIIMENAYNTTTRNPFIIPGLKKVNVESQLNPIYSFDNFIEGDCNRLARSAGWAVSQK